MPGSAVGGRAELRHVQGILLDAGSDLKKRLLAETRKAMPPTERQIRVATGRLPTGYIATMARAVKVKTRVTSGVDSVRAKVRVTALGRAQKRDVNRIDAGRLRHPLFGNRLRWYTTTVTPRFVRDPIDLLGKRIGDGAERAANDVADEILRG
jgi:hypothetical protein